jgi:Asp-tRNA(Asn)/Glu-tRNA(Gln) amidotransferase A subunit family amidase
MTRSADDSFDLVEATVGEVHDAIEGGELTAERLVDDYLERIRAYDDELNAIITVNEDAPRRAARLDSRFESDGFVGPLHGIPVVLKDNQNTHDMPTTAGASALADLVPPSDATVVKRLRDAGVVVVAKANLQELSFGVDTISSLGGATRNAYALDRRPSGSSGGTAAAIAANFGVVGTGSDTCSSVRSPPAFNNLVGIRPTRGLLSRTGIVPLSETQDTAGPITRTVADAARTLDAVAGYDPDDPVTARGVGQVPDQGYTSYLDADALDDARIGVVREFFGLQDAESAPAERAAAVTDVVDDAIEEMRAGGASIVDPVDVGGTGLLESARVLHYEFKRDMDEYLDAYGDTASCDSLVELVESGDVTPTVASRIRQDGILDVDVEGLSRDPAYLRRLARRDEIATTTTQLFVEHDLDALLYPPATIPPVEIPENQPFAELNCELAAHTGFPAIVVPAGFTDGGLPVGVELLGREFAEPRLLELAYAYEQATEHRRPPSGFGALT